jgi:hypothetical protein
VTNTHFEPHLSSAAQDIAAAAGLEPAYKGIAKTFTEGNKEARPNDAKESAR